MLRWTLESVLARYADRDLEVRRKAPLLQIFVLAALAVVICALLLGLLSPRLFHTTSELSLLTLGLALSAFFLAAGWYSIGLWNLLAVGLLEALLFLWSSDPITEETQILLLFTNAIATMLLAAFFGRRTWEILAILGIWLLLVGLTVAIPLIPLETQDSILAFRNGFGMFLVVSLFAWFAFRVNRLLFAEMQSQAHAMGEKLSEAEKLNQRLREETEEKSHIALALRKSEERFRELAELLPEALFEADSNTRISYANRRALEMFGYTKADIDRGLSGFDMLIPEDRRKAGETFENRIQGVDPGVAEYTAIRKDGTTFPILFHAGPIHHDGKFSGLRGVIVDISERKRIEASIQSTSAGIRRLVDASPMGVHSYLLLPDGNLVFSGANPAAQKILGLDHTGLVGKTIEEAFPGLINTEVPDRYRRAAAFGETWHTEQIEYDSGGVKGAYQVVAFQTLPGEMAAFFLDITQRKQAEEALRESERRFRNVVEQSNDAIYILFQGKFDLANRKFCEITGTTPETTRAQEFDFWDLVAPESVPLIQERQRKRARGEEIPSVYEFQIRQPGGKRVQVEASVTEIDYKGGRAVLGVLRDVTEHRALEVQANQAQKLDSIGRLSGGVAHDLNNLLTPIIGYGEILSEDPALRPEQKESASEIVRAAFRARDLVQQLLAFSRRQTLEFHPIDLGEMLAAFERLLRRTIRENIAIIVRSVPNLPAFLGDRGKLEQVIMNLAVNAQDAMRNGGTLLVEADEVFVEHEHSAHESDLKAGNYVRLSISDDGHGMDSETRTKIFEPFFTTKEKGKGTGLGLATVYGIVRQHGGSILVDSAPGRGSRFECYFPAVDARQPESSTAENEQRELDGNETIMVVEDEQTVRRLAVTLLVKHGYTVLEAANGDQCVSILAGHSGPLDLLLTDVVLPGMNGRRLFETISVKHPTLKVLYMSGYNDDVVSHHGVLDKGLEFIAKPFSSFDLASKVRHVLGEKGQVF